MQWRQEPMTLPPFILTFCRPINLPCGAGVGGQMQVFATIGDGFHQERVVSWPKLGLPFPMNPSRILYVRIHLAADERAFERGACKEVAACYLPLWRLPEFADTRGALDGSLPELWLALEAPRPLPFGEEEMADGGQEGEEQQLQRAKLQAELLGRFERARELAIADPSRPRICIIVQARNDINTAMTNMVRPMVPASLGGPPDFSRPLSAGVGQGSWLNNSLSLGHGQAAFAPAGHFAGAPLEHFATGPMADAAGPVPGGVPCDVAGDAAGGQAANGVHAASFQQGAGGEGAREGPSGHRRSTSNNDTFWRSRWEDERRLSEERQAHYAQTMKEARKEIKYRDFLLSRLGVFMSTRMVSSQLAACLDLWRLWVADLKRTTQFEQLTDDCDAFQLEHDREQADISSDLNRSSLKLQDQSSKIETHAQDWSAKLPQLSAFLQRQLDTGLLAAALAGWRGRAARRAAVLRLFADRRQATLLVSATRLFALWRAQVGAWELEDMTQREREVRASLSRDVRSDASARALRAMELANAWSQSADPLELQRETFAAWRRAATALQAQRARLAQLLSSGLVDGLMSAFLYTCLLLWRSVTSSVETHRDAESKAGRTLIALRRRCWARQLDESLEDRLVLSARAVLQCWHLAAVCGTAQRGLEKVFTQQQDTDQHTAELSTEASASRRHFEAEESCFRRATTELGEELRTAESERLSRREALNEAELRRSALELRCDHVAAETRSMAEALMQTEALDKQEAIAGVDLRERAELREEAAETRALAVAEEGAAAELEARRLQQEATRSRERRQRDVRDARNQLRSQTLRQEDAAARLLRAHRDDGAVRSNKLKQSEVKAARLSEEATRLRHGLREELPARTLALEEETATLREEAQEVERTLLRAEDAERARRARAAALRGSREELRGRLEALERQVRSARGAVEGNAS